MTRRTVLHWIAWGLVVLAGSALLCILVLAAFLFLPPALYSQLEAFHRNKPLYDGGAINNYAQSLLVILAFIASIVAFRAAKSATLAINANAVGLLFSETYPALRGLKNAVRKNRD